MEGERPRLDLRGEHPRTMPCSADENDIRHQLYVGDEKRRPISRFEKSKRIRDNAVSPPAETWTPGKLLLDKRAGEIQDTVVVSFLFLEKSRRARENSTMNHATSSGLPLQV
jgi:hypothetical protein